MKSALRIVVLLFTTFPIQRWLGSIALLFLAVACFGYPFALVALVLPLLGPVLMGGIMLRSMASPRVLQLIPHVRLKLLAGILLSTLVISASISVMFWAMGRATSPSFPFSFPMLMVITESIVSLVLLSQFAMARNAFSMLIWFVLIASAPYLTRAFKLIGPTPIDFVFFCGLGLVCWTAFVAWFLRASAFSAPDLTPRSTADSSRIFTIDSSGKNAIRILLVGGPSSVAGRFLGGLLAAMLLGAVWVAVFAKAQPAWSVPTLITKAMMPAVAVGALFGGTGAFNFTRRSKYLWLASGLDRRGIFRLCERFAWKSFAAMALPLFILPALACLHDVDAAGLVALFLLAHLSAAVCVIYLGLMNVRGWTPTDLLIAAALLVAWSSLLLTSLAATQKPGLSGTQSPVLLLAFMAGASLVAFTLRAIARHRWQRIDWLVCRPPQPSSINVV
jgi:hypothetical protein